MKKRIFLLLILFIFPFIKVDAASISYSAHVQSIGWMDYVKNDEIGGTYKKSLRLEAIKIKLDNKEYSGNIEYSAHVQSIGWMDYVKNDEIGGTYKRSLRLEAIKIKLSGEIANHYDVCYQAHVQSIGWMDYVCNDEIAGTTKQSLRLEALRIKLVSKDEISRSASISYTSSIEDLGFQDYINEGISGSTGKSKFIDRIKIKLDNNNIDGDITYQTYQNNSWGEYVSNDSISGIENKQIEAIKVKLIGEISDYYDIYYRVHVSNIGWMAWTKNDLPAGTNNYYERVEAIEIKLETKDSDIDTSGDSFLEGNNNVLYSAHVQSIGWMDYVSNGEQGGTVKQKLRLESLKIKLDSSIPGDIKYQTYVAKRGWQEEVKNDSISGTTKLSRNIEAIKIRLEGKISNYYDVYYRTHCSDIGWLSWTKNGEISGSLNSNTQIEAIEIKLIKKTDKVNLDITKPYVSGKWSSDKKNYYDYFGNKVTGFRLIDGIKYYFNQEGILYGSNVEKTIDVSSWQQNINWDLIKQNEDVDSAIIRVGYGTTLYDECGLDSKFDYNIQNVQRLEIPYGIYIYGYAEYDSSAKKEANFVLENLRKYNVPKETYIWYDAELDIPFNTYRAVIPIFVQTMKDAGYKNVGVYSSVSRFDTTNGNLNDPTIRSYPIWVAQYYRKNQYSGEYKIWQYASDGIVDGIKGYVDVNMQKK